MAELNFAAIQGLCARLEKHLPFTGWLRATRPHDRHVVKLEMGARLRLLPSTDSSLFFQFWKDVEPENWNTAFIEAHIKNLELSIYRALEEAKEKKYIETLPMRVTFDGESEVVPGSRYEFEGIEFV